MCGYCLIGLLDVAIFGGIFKVRELFEEGPLAPDSCMKAARAKSKEDSRFISSAIPHLQASVLWFCTA